jgi:hypothetical protein
MEEQNGCSNHATISLAFLASAMTDAMCNRIVSPFPLRALLGFPLHDLVPVQ